VPHVEASGVLVRHVRPTHVVTGHGHAMHARLGQSASVVHSATGAVFTHRGQHWPGDVTSWEPIAQSIMGHVTSAHLGSGPTQVGQQLPW
jgi:hypothetical protein